MSRAGLGVRDAFVALTQILTQISKAAVCVPAGNGGAGGAAAGHGPRKNPGPPNGKCPGPRRPGGQGNSWLGKNGVWVGNSQVVTYREDPRGRNLCCFYRAALGLAGSSRGLRFLGWEEQDVPQFPVPLALHQLIWGGLGIL